MALESAPKAMRDLIEFEPSEAENTITILVSELTAFGFLLEHYGPVTDGGAGDDFRYARLVLRKDEYNKTAAMAYCRAYAGDAACRQRERDLRDRKCSPLVQAELDAVANDARQWGRACETANEVKKRLIRLFPHARLEWPLAPPNLDAERLAAQ